MDEFFDFIKKLIHYALWIGSFIILIHGCLQSSDAIEFLRYIGAWLVCILYMI